MLQWNNKYKLIYAVVTTPKSQQIYFSLILRIYWGSIKSLAPCCSHWGIQIEEIHVDRKASIWNIASGHSRKSGELPESFQPEVTYTKSCSYLIGQSKSLNFKGQAVELDM